MQTCLEMFKAFYSTSDWWNDPFLLYHWLFWIQSNFQVTKKQKKKQKKSLYQVSHSQNSLRTRQTNAGDKGCAVKMRRGLRRKFFHPERPTLTSRSLQSITRPFQKRFREVFGNARILIFYLSIKAWEEKSLPKSHLGWFFLVFGEGKATKENMSIFWFIWPSILKIPRRKSIDHVNYQNPHFESGNWGG